MSLAAQAWGRKDWSYGTWALEQTRLSCMFVTLSCLSDSCKVWSDLSTPWKAAESEYTRWGDHAVMMGYAPGWRLAGHAWFELVGDPSHLRIWVSRRAVGVSWKNETYCLDLATQSTCEVGSVEDAAYLKGLLEQVLIGVLRGVAFALEWSVAVAMGNPGPNRWQVSRLFEKDTPGWAILLDDGSDDSPHVHIRVAETLHVVCFCVSVVWSSREGWETCRWLASRRV